MRKLLTLLVMAVALTTFADTSTTYAIGNLSFNTSGETREASVDTYTIIGAKLTSSINPAIYGEGTSAELRVYANGTVTVSTTSTAFTRLVFNLSAQGKKRLPPITASVGTVATQSSGDETVTWTGSATSVTFTVGAKADYGSEGSSKAGQFCIQSFTVTTPSSSATVDTPTFSPVGGTYTSAQSVTINCTTSDATIHYTTDGTTPTSSSATYSSAINVSETTTIKAIAVKSGMTNSEVATATYTINLPQVETPTFSPAAGTYTSAQSVTINCATSGATIYYTTDGSTPTTSSATYSGAISVSSTTTIKAIAVKNDMTDSEVASATYTIEAGSSGGGDGLTYEKVTSISSSDVGKKFIIVYEATPAAMGAISSTSTTYGQSITGTSNFTLSDSQITLTSNSSVAPLTLGGTSGAWTFLFEDGKYMSWSSGNSLASATSVSTNSQWAVTSPTEFRPLPTVMITPVNCNTILHQIVCVLPATQVLNNLLHFIDRLAAQLQSRWPRR